LAGTAKGCAGVRIAFNLPEQGVPEGFLSIVGSIINGYIDRHNSVQGLDAEVPVDVGMQNGDVAVPDDPLWFFLKDRKVDLVDDPYRSVSPSCANDRPYGIIIQHLLQIRQPHFIPPCKLVAFPENVRAQYYLQPPFLENPDRGMHAIKIDASRRGYYADLV
jgi:hypothetical protein